MLFPIFLELVPVVLIGGNDMLNFAIAGFGGLGKVHFNNVLALERERGDIRLTSICDIDESRFIEAVATNLGGSTLQMDLSCYNLYTDFNEMLEKEPLDFIITALPTYLHEKYAVMALEKGLHVFSEKPMARTLAQCNNMIRKAQESNKRLMIGQCLRYWPEYTTLKRFLDSGEFGKVVRAEFSRYSPTPTWSCNNWLMDFEKSGCAPLDLHIHDIDCINWMFGVPNAVSSRATNSISKYDSIITTYHYDDKLVTSVCDWGMANSYPFQMVFMIRLEKAVIQLKDNVLMIYPDNGEAYSPEVVAGSAYANELNDFIDCISQNKELSVVTPESAMLSVKIALAEMESAEKGEMVNV